MQSIIEKTKLPLRYRSTMIIVLSLVGSVLAYMLVAYVMTQSRRPTLPDQHTALLLRIIYGAAFLLSLGVIIGRRALFNTSRLMRLVEESGLSRLVDELATKTIVLAVLSELIALLGLVLSLLTKSFDAMWRLGAVGVILLFYNVPRRSAWERTVENLSRIAYEE